MKKLVLALFIALAGGVNARETFTVKVLDMDGAPVTDAKVDLKTMNKVILFGSDKPKDFDKHSFTTDTNGVAVLKFRCVTGSFTWWISSPTCYSSEVFDTDFEMEEIVTPLVLSVILHSHEKNETVRLYRKKNPRPMYAYTSNIASDFKVKAPFWNGRFGFDLQHFDWLPPLGKGEVADFYYVRDAGVHSLSEDEKDNKKISALFSFRSDKPNHFKEGDIVGRIEFPPHCGAYIAKQTGAASFPSTYRADSEAKYERIFPIAIEPKYKDEPYYKNANMPVRLHQAPILREDEYMVIRSRVVCDDKGEIVSANYSKILGEFSLWGYVFAKETVFNPDANDTNLEFDPQQNLFRSPYSDGKGWIP